MRGQNLEISRSLPLHGLEGEGGANGGNVGKYYLGMFLGGAYEEALGGLHNLFGGPSVVRVSQSDGPYSFAVTRAVAGPSCADVLRVMQHEPELMFEILKHRVQECYEQRMEDEDEDSIHNASSALASSLARSFDNMPYLAVDSCSSSSNNNGFYYCASDDDFNGGSAPDSVAAEDEQWSYSVA